MAHKDVYTQTAAQMRAKAKRRPRRILVTDEDRKRWARWNWSDAQIRSAKRIGWTPEVAAQELLERLAAGETQLQALLKHLGAGHRPVTPKTFRIRQATLEKFVELDHLEDGPALAAIMADLMRDRPDKVRDAMLERLDQRLREWMTQLKPIPASIGNMTPNQLRAVVKALFPDVTA